MLKTSQIVQYEQSDAYYTLDQQEDQFANNVDQFANNVDHKSVFDAHKYPIDYAHINKNLLNLVDQFGFRFGDFSKFLQDTKSIVSGGSILKVLTSTDMKESDMDIYVPLPQKDNAINLLKSYGYVLYMDFHKDKMHPYRRVDHLLSVYKFRRYTQVKIGNLRFDLPYISIDLIIAENPIDCIKKYDFSFLLNWYDGNSIKVVKPDSIIYKNTKLNSQTERHMNMRRIKYRERGYKINFDKYDFTRYNWEQPYEIPIGVPSINYDILLELIGMPPCKLLPRGGIMYQEAMEEFSFYSLQGY